ncbi:MAG: hypothetical protein EXS31_11970, partial [Pedosphaera sp.]|nr:hypothetical protein [Pedosphaera sp.]
MDSNRKSELASRLMYYPLLRMLLLDRWFRLGLPVFLGVIAVAVLALPKFWVTSPPDVVPAIRVSIVDRIQAWSFKRTAHRAVADRNHEEAQSSWMVAVANNPADLAALRDLLGHFLEHGESLKHTSQVVPQAQTSAKPSDWLWKNGKLSSVKGSWNEGGAWASCCSLGRWFQMEADLRLGA